MRKPVIFLTAFACSLLSAAEKPSARAAPKEIGSRTVVLDFAVDKNDHPVSLDIFSSEAAGLDPWAKLIVSNGQVKTDSPGVEKIGERKYRATISFPVEGDGPPLPPEVTFPKARILHPIQYPYELARDGIAGGVLLKLTIDETAKVTNVELVRASHEAFGKAAVGVAKRWQFSQPAKKDGKPIAVTLFQLITFEVEGKQIAPWQWQICPEPCLEKFSMTGSFVPARH